MEEEVLLLLLLVREGGFGVGFAAAAAAAAPGGGPPAAGGGWGPQGGLLPAAWGAAAAEYRCPASCDDVVLSVKFHCSTSQYINQLPFWHTPLHSMYLMLYTTPLYLLIMYLLLNTSLDPSRQGPCPPAPTPAYGYGGHFPF